MTPALIHCLTSLSTLRSLTLRATRPRSRAGSRLPKEDSTHYPPRALSGDGVSSSPAPSSVRKVAESLRLDPSPRPPGTDSGLAGRVQGSAAGELDRSCPGDGRRS